MDESIKKDRIIIAGLVVKDNILRSMNKEIDDCIVKSTRGLVDPSSIVIHMKEFTTGHDELSRIIKMKIPGISSDELINIKRELLHGIIDRLIKFHRDEVFAVASIITRQSKSKFKYALKFALERAAMNIENDILLPVFDTPGREFSSSDIKDAYLRLVRDGTVSAEDRVPTYPDIRAKLFEEILLSSSGDKIHRGLQIADIIAWTLNRSKSIAEGICRIEDKRKDKIFNIEELCNKILHGLFITRENKVLTIKIY